jgi:peptidyl-prolyl cis-trans isomerase SurA
VQTVVQSRARHILLRTGPQLTQAAALARLADYKQRIVTGKADFPGLAREFSQDGSAAQGGDLGWATPGMFVPEFEEVLNRLNEGEISNPTVSRFGVHLMQLMERRRVDLSPQQTRQLISNQLREAKYEEAYVAWARDLRERAYVEFRDPPQ